jgi:hypothetical protein
VHPGRVFAGREQVRANWSTIFDAVPIFAADLVNVSRDDHQVWSDWRWSGTRQDGSRLDVAGVIVAGVRDRRIAWARLYMEPVEAAQESIDVAIRSMASGPEAPRAEQVPRSVPARPRSDVSERCSPRERSAS